jgi:hypothetical protein
MNDRVIQLGPMMVAPGCSVGRAPATASWPEREAMLDEYDVVVITDEFAITRASRLPKLTGEDITVAMVDQFTASLRDVEVRAGGAAQEN